MARYGHLTALDASECRQLLAGRSVGRVGWLSGSGLQILPVNYSLVGDVIVFRTQTGSILSELQERMPVSFQVDDLDDETGTGWTVLVQGRSGASVAELPDGFPLPWAPGERQLIVGVAPEHYSGRSVAAE